MRTVKYGETSLVVTVFTELFGLQSYLINGVRTSSKRAAGFASMLQPVAQLDMVVYHSELKQLQRVKEFKWAFIYQHLLTDVPKNAVSLFMIELLTKCLKQPESHPELFHFTEDALQHLDQAESSSMANFPLFFALHLPVFFGFRIDDNYSERNTILDLQEGSFVSELPNHNYYLDEKLAFITSQLLKVRQPEELSQIKLNQEYRRSLLHAYERFYSLHIADFGTLKTLPVIKEVLG